MRRRPTLQMAALSAVMAWICLALPVFAGDAYKPFVAARSAGANVQEAASNVTAALKSAGFEVVGEYSPYPDGSARIIGVTTPELKKAAAKTTYGGFGAVARVSVTDNQGSIEVSYTNPVYMGHAYKMGDPSGVAAQLAKALGSSEEFGAKGLTQKQLENYHFMMFMPYFKDRKTIATLAGQSEAVGKVEQALGDSGSDMSVVWRVDIDENQTLFGVQLGGGKWAQGRIQQIMGKIDLGTPRSTAALPWEILVTGGEVVYLPGKYRIAVMFPDLTMGTFMQISDVPDDMDASAKALGSNLKK